MTAVTAATLRAVARRADRLADQIRALAELLDADPDLNARPDELLVAAASVHEAASGVLAAADALPRRRPRPRTVLGALKERQETAARTEPVVTELGAPALAASQTAGPAPFRSQDLTVAAGPASHVATRLEPHGDSPVSSGLPAVSPPADDVARRCGVVAAAPHPAAAEKVVAMAEPLVAPLTPWQRQLLETVFTVPGRLSASGSAPGSLEPRPFIASPVCPPPVLRSRGRAALARLQALVERAAYEAGLVCGKAIGWLCRRLPALPECAGLEWR